MERRASKKKDQRRAGADADSENMQGQEATAEHMATPPRARNGSKQAAPDYTPLSTRAARNSERDDAESELEYLRTRVHDLQEENRHHADIISRDSLQNLSHLLSTAHRIQGEVASLISDVQALAEQAKRQKQLTAVPYMPVRSRTGSSASADPPVVHAPETGTSPTSSKEPATKAREFTWRDSQLTTMFRTSSDIKTIYNMFVAVLILFAIKLIINDVFTVGVDESSELSLKILTAAFGQLHWVISGWLMMFCTHSLILPIMWLWKLDYLGDIAYTGLYALLQGVFTLFFAVFIIHCQLPIASSMIMLCEQVRMIMKSHSFWRETLRIRHHPTDIPRGVNIHLSNSDSNTHLLPTFREQLDQFVLFHFVPTLIYRNTYPRTRYIRWDFVLTCLVEVIGCVFYIYVLFANFCIPEFQSTASNPGDLRALIVSLFNSVLPGIAVYLLSFFGLLHSWMNMFAELTRFADRLFYLDWWNTTSFSSYYRRWNMIVHDSLYNYIYVDLRRLGVPTGVGFFLTFFVSAVVHEYIICVALQFFYPVLLVMFLCFGVAFVYLTKLFNTDNSRAWNIFFWTNLIIGNGLLLIMYSREYYAHQPMTGKSNVYQFDTTSWMPYSWQPFIRG